jgi:YVTN family beta-propeller protein
MFPRMVRISLLCLACTPAFAQGPNNGFFNNYWAPMWEFITGHKLNPMPGPNPNDDPYSKIAKVYTECVDTCRGSQPISVCTTEIVNQGKVVSQEVTVFDYPQDPNFMCDYPEGNPGGSSYFRASTGGLGKGNQLLSTDRPATNQHDASLATSTQPYVQLSFPPFYQARFVPSPQPCDPSNTGLVYVVNHTLNTVVQMAACTGRIVAKIPVGSNPLKVAVTPDGKLALVTMYDGGVAFIDTSTNQVAFTLPTGTNVHPSGIDITPDGTQAWITNYFDDGSSVLVIDIAQRKIINTIPVPTFPQSVYISPDGLLAWVTLPFNNAIYVIDTLTQTVARTLGVTAPYGIAFNSTGTRAYIANNGSSTIQVMDTTTYQTVKTYNVGTAPVDVLITNDNGFLFVTNNGGGSVSVIDLTNDDVQTVAVGPNPRGLVQVQ